jgi:hypothetical protein
MSDSTVRTAAAATMGGVFRIDIVSRPILSSARFQAKGSIRRRLISPVLLTLPSYDELRPVVIQLIREKLII